MHIDWRSRIFSLTSQFQDDSHDVISRKKVLPSWEYKHSIRRRPVHLPAAAYEAASISCLLAILSTVPDPPSIRTCILHFKKAAVSVMTICFFCLKLTDIIVTVVPVVSSAQLLTNWIWSHYNRLAYRLIYYVSLLRMFSYRVGFSGTANLSVKILVSKNPIWWLAAVLDIVK